MSALDNRHQDLDNGVPSAKRRRIRNGDAEATDNGHGDEGRLLQMRQEHVA